MPREEGIKAAQIELGNDSTMISSTGSSDGGATLRNQSSFSRLQLAVRLQPLQGQAHGNHAGLSSAKPSTSSQPHSKPCNCCMGKSCPTSSHVRMHLAKTV